MKIIKKAPKLIQAFDYFAPDIKLHYQSDNDYKTITGGFFSILLYMFFTYMSISSFLDMIQRTKISFTVIQSHETEPNKYQFSTDNNMFAIGISNISMNSERYFNINFTSISVINGTKTFIQIPLQACTVDQWSKFGNNFVDHYNRLNFSQWLCPSPNTKFSLAGKYSSNIFNYIKIGIGNCTGIVNGNGCQPLKTIQEFINNRQTFSFNFYFINTLLNAGDQKSSTIYLDDTNNFFFSFGSGPSINYYFQQYKGKTDMSLLPYEQSQIQQGLIRNTKSILNWQKLLLIFKILSKKVSNYLGNTSQILQIR